MFIFIFGILTGTIGYIYKELPEKLYDSDKIIYSSLLGGTAILACLKWINSLVGQEIEAELDLKKTKLYGEIDHKVEEKVEEKIINFVYEYSENIKGLKEDIYQLDDTQDKEKILIRFFKLESAHRIYQYKRKSAQKIANWLSCKENKISLQKVAMNAVSKSKFTINKQHLSYFEKDIQECLKWLRYSISDREAYKYQADRHASAMVKFSVNLSEAYKIALYAIKNHIDEEFNNQTEIVEEMIEYLIKQIKQ